MAAVKGYTLKQIAKRVGSSAATIVRWMELKKVAVNKKKTASNHYIFTEADLQKFKSYKDGIKQAD
jgi:DNA-binding transcriptional MerR regulator